jgi:hypothetical protein
VIRSPLAVAIIILAALAAVFLAAHCGLYDFKIDHNLNAVDLATLAVNIFIAYFLQYYFISRATDVRSEKDILIDGLRDVVSSLRQCRDTLFECYDAGNISGTHAKSIIMILRKISNGLESSKTAIEMSQCSTLKTDCVAVQDSLVDYKTAATGGSFPAKPYDAQTFSYQEQKYRTLNEKLHTLLFKINQHR